MLSCSGREDLALVYVARLRRRKAAYVEFVESVAPPLCREEKWVLILSSLAGCPVKCLLCDAHQQAGLRLAVDELEAQIDWMVSSRYGPKAVPARKWKIQFARMGEPALNPAVLEVLRRLPQRWPSLHPPLPCLSTIAPAQSRPFFDELTHLRHSLYSSSDFQLQFSLHSTNKEVRNRLMPFPRLSLADIARLGEAFYRPPWRKVSLNFALMEGIPVEAERLAHTFDPACFAIKLTPLNPTRSGHQAGLISALRPEDPAPARPLLEKLRELGFEAFLSIGEPEEDTIGSNCGQHVTSWLEKRINKTPGYTKTW